jgi:hypothetical protein
MYTRETRSLSAISRWFNPSSICSETILRSDGFSAALPRSKELLMPAFFVAIHESIDPGIHAHLAFHFADPVLVHEERYPAGGGAPRGIAMRRGIRAMNGGFTSSKCGNGSTY